MILKDLKKVLTVHHVFNALLSVSYYVLKVIPPICHVIHGENAKCVLNEREYEILLFLAVVIYVKNRKAASFLHYLSNVFLFAKIANAFMFYWINPAYGVIYGSLCVVQMVLFPEPAFTGPEKVVYFRGPNLSAEIARDNRVAWLVEFYANWSPLCQQVAPVFAELSNKYALPNLKFAKLDVGRYPTEAEKYNVNCNATSKQLPTLILFQNGQEVRRRPVIDQKKHVFPFVFREENIILEFDLNNVYNECKSNLTKRQKSELQQETNNAAAKSDHEKHE